jgi:hypothetical protein
VEAKRDDDAAELGDRRVGARPREHDVCGRDRDHRRDLVRVRVRVRVRVKG